MVILFGIYLQVQQFKNNSTMRPIVVTTSNIASLQQLTAQNLKVVYVPASSVPPFAISNIAYATGKYVQTEIFSGEPVLVPMISGSLSSFSYGLLPGQFIISLPDSSQILGFVAPGNTINIIGYNGGATPPTLIASNIRIISVSGQTSSGSFLSNFGNLSAPNGQGASNQNILVAVTTQQAEQIFAYSTTGHIMYEVSGK